MESLFKALGDANRRKILEILRKKDMNVSEILTHFSITQASLSHHLDILKRADLILARREGQFMIYSLNTSVFEEIATKIYEYIKRHSS